MRQFLAVFRFELTNYFKNKGYIITTALISVVLIIGLSIPSFIDVSGIFGGSKEEKSNKTESSFIIYDANRVIKDTSILENTFVGSKWKVANSEEEIKDAVNKDEVKAGFIVESSASYKYVVQNSSFTDSNQEIFEGLLSKVNRQNYLKDKGINVDEMDALYNQKIQSEVTLLGKDTVNNFAYTYGLIFVLYFMIIFYGQIVAVSVTSEKSNRAIEVLVTSTSSNSLIFGKVIGATVASIVQIGVILSSALITYRVNSVAWGGKLDFVFNIPLEVILTFAVFGVIGYLFYSFIFGALGALVSKTEDVGKTASPITMIFVAVFMAVMFGLRNPESGLMQVLSYIPFSSCMAMFVRVAMGTVPLIEVVISLAILVASTGFIGVMGAKIYRRGTLMYGNPIKISKAFKLLKKE